MPKFLTLDAKGNRGVFEAAAKRRAAMMHVKQYDAEHDTLIGVKNEDGIITMFKNVKGRGVETHRHKKGEAIKSF